ncbi:hypothetical protein HUT18_18945 [Streptomyces sp. NA04227]|uniref:hypothetical protein n=1 Tax=Streptomyces sp. NA04227 TaxID=2742136 RepID=UPI001591238B|nr:hypothetical protein [Streptomyces sp. NA04227]QKW08143.1 hypothetical protein HUT18_18945 [Streptomyces sp. NA04227]
MSPDEDEHSIAVLRERLRTADEEIRTPQGLWERVRESAGPESPMADRAARRRGTGFALAAALAVASLGLGSWWVFSPGQVNGQPAAAPGIRLEVHNAESVCREQHTLECALRVARTPYGRYAARDNAAGRVWAGDVLTAKCVVPDGTLVRDESGVSSTRWYAVEKGDGTHGWLPGVRTRNSTEVRVCSPDEAPRRHGGG